MSLHPAADAADPVGITYDWVLPDVYGIALTPSSARITVCTFIPPKRLRCVGERGAYASTEATAALRQAVLVSVAGFRGVDGAGGVVRPLPVVVDRAHLRSRAESRGAIARAACPARCSLADAVELVRARPFPQRLDD